MRISKLFRRMALAAGLSLAPFLVRADSSVALTGIVLQRIDGFGASDAWFAPEIQEFPQATRDRILDALFSPTKGAGLSLLRHRIPPEIEPSEGVWDWSADEPSAWLQSEATRRGATAWSTVWSPPAWMKANDSVDNGGNVLESSYQAYADYLAAYVQHYRTAYGEKIYGVSIQNEPDITASYESCNWDSQQFHDFIEYYLAPTFQADHIDAKIILPEQSGWIDDYASATLTDPATVGSIGIIAAHNYWGTLQPFSDAIAAGKTVWETEVSNLGPNDPTIVDGLRWAETLHHTLVEANANAWHYWWAFCDITFSDTGQSLILGDLNANTFFTNKRLWTIGNYSRFVRPGAHLVGLTTNYPERGLLVTAFRNEAGDTTVVAINSNSYPAVLSVRGLRGTHTGETIYRTSATEDLAEVGRGSIRSETFSWKLEPKSVTSFVQGATSQS